MGRSKGGTMNIIITGGGGSLGQTFAKKLHKEHKVTLIDNNEWSLAQCQLPVEKLLMDFSDWKFDRHPCDLVIHCAAYKHVNLGEENVESFIENNIGKTTRLFREAYKYNSDVLFISTDKAVEPISVYGVTKFMGERLCRTFNFAVVRLGNILSSNGSVIPLWEKQIENKEPITITDERMVRYVIEDYDAVNQIWDIYMSGKKLIIPKCKEIRLLDLLTEVLVKHGLTISDVNVNVIGMRPGEKLREVLKWEDEE
jgi:FlaA1/EpsC-like NDP-sugar epimerase